MHSLQSNIWKLKVIQVLRWFLLSVPILVLFYQSHGLSIQEILLIQGAFSAATLILEIPTGYFADLAGRKFSLIFGLSLCALGWILYSVSTSFINFLSAELLLAAGTSLISGSDTALLYDTLENLDLQNTFKKLQSNQTALWHFSEASASIIGAGLATASLVLPFYFQAAVIALAIPIACTLIEPKRKILDTTTGKFKSLLHIIKSTLHSNQELAWLIIYNSGLSACSIAVVWFLQARFQAAHVPLKYLGVLWAISLLIAGTTSHYAYYVENWLGKKHVLNLLIPAMCIGLILFGILPPVAGLFAAIIIYIVRGLNIPIFMDYVNEIAAADSRATIISINAMVTRLLFTVLGPLLGYINDTLSFQTAFIATASMLFVVYITAQYKFKRI